MDNVKGTSASFHSALDIAMGQDQPYDPLRDAGNIGLIGKLVNGNAVPHLRLLLGSILTTLDASIPNKDQNRAVKHLIRTQFDHAYGGILQRAYPDCQFGHAPGGYALSPASNASEAFQESLIQK